MLNPEAGDQGGLLAAKVQRDADFRKRLLSNPVETLRAEGVQISPDVKVKVVENTADLIHIVLPAKQVALADEALDKVTAGTSDSDKPCGKYSCDVEYNSAACWAKWFVTLGLCKYIGVDVEAPDPPSGL